MMLRFLSILAQAVIVFVMFMVGASLIGYIAESSFKAAEQRERCLKAAHTGWEIERCR